MKEKNDEVKHFSLTAEMFANEPVYNKGKSFKNAKWKAGSVGRLLSLGSEDQEDLVQDFLVGVWKKRGEYEETKGSRGGFTAGIIDGEAKNAYRALEAYSERFGLSVDAKVEGGADGSREETHADTLSDSDSAQPLNYRGARAIRTTADLHILKALMSPEDWKLFSIRWKYDISDADLARHLGWTENKLRWRLKKFAERYAAFLDVKPHSKEYVRHFAHRAQKPPKGRKPREIRRWTYRK